MRDRQQISRARRCRSRHRNR